LAVAGLLLANPAHASQVVVNTTSMSLADNTKCGLYEALDAIEFQYDATSVGCPGAIGADTIKINAGTYHLKEGLQIVYPLVNVIGAGVGKTILTTDQYPGDGSDRVIVVADTGNIAQLTLQGTAGTFLPLMGIWVQESASGTIDHVRVTGFTAGGILNDGYLEITFSTVDNNKSGSNGGGIVYSSGGRIWNSTINNNSAPSGGGLWVSGGRVDLAYSTIANNKATAGRGGGVFVSASGGGLDAECDGNHVTVAFNSASVKGGGVFMGPQGPGEGTSNFSTRWNAGITAKNTGARGAADDFIGTMRGSGLLPHDGLERNLVGVLSNPAPIGWNMVNQGVNPPKPIGDIVGDPLFNVGLASNGGPTQTIALKTSPTKSPAVDAGSAAHEYESMQMDTTDQRGPDSRNAFSAPVHSRYDLGSYEAR
jgi:hypothetical protein